MCTIIAGAKLCTITIFIQKSYSAVYFGDGRVVRWCWVNFQCRGVLLIWIRVGQGPIALAMGAGGGLFGHGRLPERGRKKREMIDESWLVGWFWV